MKKERTPVEELSPSYEAWFKAQVEEALKSKVAPIPHKKVMKKLKNSLKEK